MNEKLKKLLAVVTGIIFLAAIGLLQITHEEVHEEPSAEQVKEKQRIQKQIEDMVWSGMIS